MAITHFTPEVWAAAILSILDKNLVFAGAPCVNRNYEGEISAFGDTVHIETVGDVSIVNYTKDTDLSVQTLTDDELQLLIDQAKAFAFEIDDIDMRQVRNGGGLMAEAARRAAFGLRDVADQHVRDRMLQGASSTNDLGLVDASSTASNVYDDILVPASVKLDEANVPTDGRFIVLTPAIYGKLLLDDRFIKANEAGTAALHNGMVGDAAGFRVLKSNNAKVASATVTGTYGTKVFTMSSASIAAGTKFGQDLVGRTDIGTGGKKVTAVTASTLTFSASVTGLSAHAILPTRHAVVAGSSIATSYAEQISKVEAFRPEKRFADALKGLHLYGSKVVRADALAVGTVKTS